MLLLHMTCKSLVPLPPPAVAAAPPAVPAVHAEMPGEQAEAAGGATTSSLAEGHASVLQGSEVAGRDATRHWSAGSTCVPPRPTRRQCTSRTLRPPLPQELLQGPHGPTSM